MKNIKAIIAVFLLLSFTFTGFGKNSEMKLIQVKCQATINPEGIEVSHPAFSWIAESPQQGQKQMAYQIIVADNQKDINQDNGNVWNSEKVNSDQTSAVLYQGTPLQSNRIYYWKVRVWDAYDRPAAYSKTAKFITSILDPQLWKAKWIGTGRGKDPSNSQKFYDKPVAVDAEGDSVRYRENSLLLRKEYSFSKPVSEAIVHICGLGLYELTINGKRVGEKVLNPAKTNYTKVVLYDTYDISGFLNNGKNALGIELGNGWFNPQPKWWSWRMQWFGEKRAFLQMHVTFKDGSTQDITTDDSWKLSEGPVRHHCIYDGEIYDASKEMEGWNRPGFNDSDWKYAKTVNPPPGKLTAQIMPAIQRIEILKPVSVTYPKSNVSLIDFGQNFSGWIRIKVKAHKGDSIVIRYAEDKKDGMLDPTTNHMLKVKDIYIGKDEKEITYEPHFTYHGFQYAEVSGINYQVMPKDIEGVVVHSAVEPIGTFECSNDNINKIHKAVLWSQQANLMGYPTDSPQREERLGWLGDAHITAEEAIHNFDMNLFYTKWLNDIKVNQDPSGDIPFIAPRPISEGPAFSWSSGYHLIVWYHYLYYGDKKILADHFNSMKGYVDFLSTQADGFILPNDKYGDWASPIRDRRKSGPLSTSTGYYYYTASILAKTAQILGYDEEAKKYNLLAANIKKSFNQRYYNAEKQCYDDGSQFSNSFALFLGMADEKEKTGVMKNLVNDIMNINQVHLTTGILGTKYLIELLSTEGRSDIAWKLATQTTYPSWINMLEGRTTLSEHWKEGGMNSHNHIMFGSIDSWFYKTLAGIQTDENAPGYKNIVIKPFVPADLSWVKASVKTVKGNIRVEWTKTQKNYAIKINVPVGSEATVYVLANKQEQVKSMTTPSGEAQSVVFLKMEGNCAVFHVASGEYSFVSTGLQ